MPDSFAILRAALAEMKGFLNNMEGSPAKDDPRFLSLKDNIFCFELALTFYEEANLAIQTEAWFAAASMASSALESFLLSECLSEEIAVRNLPKFQSLVKKHQNNFRTFILSMDLGKLLEIADKLSCFPDGGIPNTFISHFAIHLDKATLANLVGLFDGYPNVGRVCANYLHGYRNLLHPAVCLREGRQPSRDAGLTATFLFLIAFTSLAGI